MKWNPFVRRSVPQPMESVPVTPQLSLAQLQAAVNSLPLGVVIVSGDRTMRWTNEGYDLLVPPSSADGASFAATVERVLNDALTGTESGPAGDGVVPGADPAR